MIHSSLWLSLIFLGMGPSAGGRPIVIAVVDIPAVSDQYLRRADLEAQFDAKRKQLSEKRDSLRDRIDRTTRSLQEEFKPGTQEYRDREKQLVMLKAQLQYFMESEGKQVEENLATSLRGIYDDIHAVIGEVARERGVDLVLAADSLPEGTPDNPTQVRQQIALQKVLYWSPRLDLTEEVIKRLNAKYKAQKASSP